MGYYKIFFRSFSKCFGFPELFGIFLEFSRNFQFQDLTHSLNSSNICSNKQTSHLYICYIYQLLKGFGAREPEFFSPKFDTFTYITSATALRSSSLSSLRRSNCMGRLASPRTFLALYYLSADPCISNLYQDGESGKEVHVLRGSSALPLPGMCLCPGIRIRCRVKY